MAATPGLAQGDQGGASVCCDIVADSTPLLGGLRGHEEGCTNHAGPERSLPVVFRFIPHVPPRTRICCTRNPNAPIQSILPPLAQYPSKPHVIPSPPPHRNATPQ